MGICVLPEKARLPDDERQWWCQFPNHRCVNAGPPPPVVFQSKSDLKSFICCSRGRNVSFVFILSASDWRDLLLWTYPSKYTDKTICDWLWIFYITSTISWFVTDSNLGKSKISSITNLSKKFYDDCDSCVVQQQIGVLEQYLVFYRKIVFQFPVDGTFMRF